MGAGGDGAEAREKGDTVGHPRKGKVASPTDAPTVHSYSHQAGDSSQQRCIHQQTVEGPGKSLQHRKPH